MHLFISHQNNLPDQKSGGLICQVIENANNTVFVQNKFGNITFFFDMESLSAGALLDTTIEENLKHADVLVVILSPQALQSVWVCKEVTQFHAIHPDGPIVPVFTQNCAVIDDQNGVLDLLMGAGHERVAIFSRKDSDVFIAASDEQIWQGIWNVIGLFNIFRRISYMIPGYPELEIADDVYGILNDNWYR